MRSRSKLSLLVAVAVGLWAVSTTAQAAEIILTDPNNGAVEAYDGTTGTAISSPLIPGLTGADALALSGNDLYVAYFVAGNQVIGEFNATTGATINSTLVTGFPGAVTGLAISGGDIFVSNFGNGVSNGSIGEYDLATGNPINASLVTGLGTTLNVALSGGDIFALQFTASNDVVGEYTTSGSVVNASLVTGAVPGFAIAIAGNDLFVGYNVYSLTGTPLNVPLFHHPSQVDETGLGDEAVSGGILYIATQDVGIAQYTLSGTPITDLSLPSRANNPLSFVVVPEPASWLMLAIGSAALVAVGWRRRGAAAWRAA